MELPEPRNVQVRRAAMIFALLATGAFTLASFAALADGADSDGDGISDAVEAATARNLNGLGIPEGRFRVQSVSVGAAPDGHDDEFSLLFERGTFAVEYRPRADREDGILYELTLKRLVEVIYDGGDIGGGDIVQEWDLTNEYWAVTTVNTTTVDGGRQFRFTAYPVPEVPTSRNLTLTVTASSRFVRNGQILVSPMEVKVDISIRGWMYDAPNSELALKIEVATEAQNTQIEEQSLDEIRGWTSDESQLNVSGELGSIFFSWSNTAIVDSGIAAVGSTNLAPSGGGTEFFLIYGRGQVTYHTSKMGVESAAFWTLVNRANQPPPLSWNPVLYALGVAAIAGLVAATVVLSRRRRREN
jgi:hypothetical protein